MQRCFSGLRLVLATFAAASSMFAVTIFSDDFPETGPNPEPAGFGFTNGTLDLLKWDVVAGSVDVLDTFLGVNCGSPSGRRCVDINGSSGVTGKIQTTQQFNFAVGSQYTLTVWVAGSQRSGTDSMRVSLGSLGSVDVTLPSTAGWQQVVLGTFAGNGSTGRIVIDGGALGADGDNIGLVIDDVVLDEFGTPEPATFLLMAAGLGMLAMRRRG